MEKQKINIIEMLYDDVGHFHYDAVKYEILCSKYNVEYHINGLMSKENSEAFSEMSVHSYEKVFGFVSCILQFRKIFKNFSKEDKNLVTSTRYIILFLYSIIFRQFNYALLVHFVPLVNTRMNHFILKYLSKRIKGFVVLDYYVQDNLRDFLNISMNQIFVIQSRSLFDNTVIKKEKKINISFIGALNESKKLDDLAFVLQNNYFKNLVFNFFSKGINNYFEQFQDKSFLEKINVVDKYFNQEEYIELYKKSHYVIIPYVKEYGIRSSAIVYDSFLNGCKIIASDLPQFKYYVDKYNAGFYYSDINDLLKILEEINEDHCFSPIDEKIYSDYSEESRKNKLFLFFENLEKDKVGK